MVVVNMGVTQIFLRLCVIYRRLQVLLSMMPHIYITWSTKQGAAILMATTWGKDTTDGADNADKAVQGGKNGDAEIDHAAHTVGRLLGQQCSFALCPQSQCTYSLRPYLWKSTWITEKKGWSRSHWPPKQKCLQRNNELGQHIWH